MNGSEVWAAVDGDTVVRTFNDIFAANQLICDDCFGKDKGDCKSPDPSCAHGLKDLAFDDDVSRWDRAAAHFAKDADISDLTCRFASNTCEAPPNCETCVGVGTWAVLKSITTLHAQLETVWRAIGAAGDNLMPQMGIFAQTFAPVPSIKDEALMSTILTAVAGGILGFIPGVGGILLGTLTGVGSGVVMHELFFGQEVPSDTSSYLGTFTNITQSTYQSIAEALFRDGKYEWKSADGSKSTTYDLAVMMANGNLLQQHADLKNFMGALVPTYERILLQQLVAFTWSNLEKDGHSHMPFIAFDNVPCDQVDANKDKSLLQRNHFHNLRDLDVAVTYEDKCYYLLDAVPDFDNGWARWNCVIQHPPGGTHKDLHDQSTIFSGLALEDFVFPSVKGWLDNHNQNDYPLASDNAQLVSDPRDAAAISIPVCDYLTDPKKPGIKCPNFQIEATFQGCSMFDSSTGANQPGAFKPGQCKVHLEQFQRHEKNLNPLDYFQLAISIMDNSNIQVGGATKQLAKRPLQITNSALPYDFIVVPGPGDNDPLELWYSDQYWKSDSIDHGCKMGDYDKGSRKGDCHFDCPLPVQEPPPSATEANPLPGPPTPAIGGAPSFVNTFITVTPSPTYPPDSPSTYATGKCKFHLRQWQKNEGPERNPTNDYDVEVTITDSKGQFVATSGKVPAPRDQSIIVKGLAKPLTITAKMVDKDPLIVEYDGISFETYSDHCTPGKKKQEGGIWVSRHLHSPDPDRKPGRSLFFTTSKTLRLVHETIDSEETTNEIIAPATTMQKELYSVGAKRYMGMASILQTAAITVGGSHTHKGVLFNFQRPSAEMSNLTD
ncbi:MAG: hypothetical protein Q9203_001676 [Teloschistes exilis]